MTALRGVTPAFAAVLEALRVDNAPITHITLNPLTAPAVAELIGSCVRHARTSRDTAAVAYRVRLGWTPRFRLGSVPC